MRTHISVFNKEAVQALQIDPTGVYVDLTLGAGGHALEIWQQLTTGTLVVFDLEQQAIDNFVPKLGKHNQRKFFAINANFANLTQELTSKGINKVNGILADLGWSMEQLERISGLSYKSEEDYLDMRLSPQTNVTAADILNVFSDKQLQQLFYTFADIRGKQAVQLVKSIVTARKAKAFATVGDLLHAIGNLNNSNPSGSALHRGSSMRFSGKNKMQTAIPSGLPARVFQALRIAVNSEYDSLEAMLPQAWETLLAGGILVVITFHSGEEKIVKINLDRWRAQLGGELLFSQGFIHPSVAQLRENLAARSAKLWAIKKTHS